MGRSGTQITICCSSPQKKENREALADPGLHWSPAELTHNEQETQ
jgi:hypothetical protein